MATETAPEPPHQNTDRATLASVARDDDDRLAPVTLIGAQVDVTDAGDLLLFLDESQVAVLEDLMWDQSYLDRPQMAGTFAAIRAEDLICSRAVQRYFLGKQGQPTDLGVWSDDTTRMPTWMRSEYLRGLLLENRRSGGRFAVEGWEIALQDVAVALFVIATKQDHRAGPHLALAVGLKDPAVHRLQHDPRAGLGRAQRRDPQRTGPRRTPPPDRRPASGRALHRPGQQFGAPIAGGRFLVAGPRRLGEGPQRSPGGPA